jgi:predicted metal-dependent hydrolase
LSGLDLGTPEYHAAMTTLKYLQGYPEALREQVQTLIDAGRLGERLTQQYAEQTHTIRTDNALFDYTQDLKTQYLRSSEPLAKAVYDNKLKVLQHALGTHTQVSRVQGGNLKAKREIRVASLFKDAPLPFLRMIVVHELAHIKHREHDKAFYSLCQHMEADYHQLEFDLRLWLTWRDLT